MYQTFLFTTLLPTILLANHIAAEILPLDSNRILRRHQQYRQAAGSSNMIKAVWSLDLAKQAEDLLLKYGDDVQTLEQQVGNTGLGINIGLSTSVDPRRVRGPQDVPIAVVDLWGSQRTRFRIMKGCGDDNCMEYLRMISAGMYEMGCALLKRGDDSVMVCLYKDIGPIDEKQPYKVGTPCSECDAAFPLCEHKMCAPSRDAPSEPDVRPPQPHVKDSQPTSPSVQEFQPRPATQTIPAQPKTPTPQVQEKAPEPDDKGKVAVLLAASGPDVDEPMTTTTSRGTSSVSGLLNGFLLLIGTALLHFGYSS